MYEAFERLTKAARTLFSVRPSVSSASLNFVPDLKKRYGKPFSFSRFVICGVLKSQDSLTERKIRLEFAEPSDTQEGAEFQKNGIYGTIDIPLNGAEEGNGRLYITKAAFKNLRRGLRENPQFEIALNSQDVIDLGDAKLYIVTEMLIPEHPSPLAKERVPRGYLVH